MRRKEISSIAGANKRLLDSDRLQAQRVLERYAPLFKALNDKGVDYCLIGGLAVMAHAYDSGMETLRSTSDADLMFDSTYTNQDFARAYMEAFGNDPEVGRRIYEEMFGDGAFEELGTGEQSLVSCAFHGVSLDPGDSSTPSFDVVRHLNTLELSDIHPDLIVIGGVDVPVAPVDVLAFMKRTTIDYMVNVLHTSPRARDFVDLDTLNQIASLVNEEARYGRDGLRGDTELDQ